MHTRHARRILVPALILLVVCLSGPPAWAIAIYDAFVDVTVSAPGPIPSGTGISLFTGSGFTPPVIEIGAAVAFNDASASTPGVVTANASGLAVASSPFSLAASTGSATTTGSLLNENTAAVAFPLTVSHIALVQASTTGPDEVAFAHYSFNVLLDGGSLLALADSCLAGAACSLPSVGSNLLSLNLTPGFHSLVITAEADGFALASEAVPEPATLILVGTTMAGLGALARVRRRRG